MNNECLRVINYCPFSHKEEFVYLYSAEELGENYFYFNGCDTNFHGCQECDSCAKEVFAELKSE